MEEGAEQRAVCKKAAKQCSGKILSQNHDGENSVLHEILKMGTSTSKWHNEHATSWWLFELVIR